MDTINVAVDENVSPAFDKLIAIGSDLTPQMKSVAQLLGSQTRLNFVDQKSPLGLPWAITARKRLDPSASILRLKGDLSGSIREEFGADFAAAGPERSGGAAAYAALHQFGINETVSVPAHERKAHSRNGKPVKAHSVKGFSFTMKITARPYLGFNDAINGRILEILAQPILALGAEEARS